MSFIKMVLYVFLIVSAFSSAFAQNEKKKIVPLEGYDAILLIKGKKVKGKESFSVVRKNFRYLFASKVNQAKFEKNPELYEVQNDGECMVMPGVKTDAGIYSVYRGKIYTFGTALCQERFSLAPQSFLNPKKQKDFKKRNVAIVLYEGVELLDFSGPGEVFAAAQTIEGDNAFNVYTVAASTEPIVSQGFLTVKPQYSFENSPKPDIVIFPGGMVENLAGDEKAMAGMKAASTEAEIVMSVCNGAFLLAKAKLLENKKITTHWAQTRNLRKQVPTAIVLENVRFVDSGRIITTAGVSAGIDGALHIVERLLGSPAAKMTAKYMEYDWQPKK